MLPVYLGALAFGGTLLIASLVLGLGHHDVGGGHDHDAHGHGEKGHASDGFGWLPVASVRFWTFFLGFGGLAGTMLTYFTGSAWPVVAGAATVVGWGAGVGVVAAMRRVKDGPGSELSAKELRGETAEVIVPVSSKSMGKVRVQAKGRVFDLIAETDEDQTFALGAKVMIVGEGEDGRVQIAAQ